VILIARYDFAPSATAQRQTVQCWGTLSMMVENAHVASDMARVFAPLADARRTAGRNRPVNLAKPRPRGRGKHLASWALLIVAVLSIGLVGFVVLRFQEPSNTISALRVPVPASVMQTSITVPQRTRLPAQSSTALTADRTAVHQLPLAFSERHERAKSENKARLDLSRRRSRGSASAVNTYKEVRSAPTSRSEPVRRASICREARDHDVCLYDEVSSADQRLRRAYDHAVEAALATSELMKVRTSWARALSRSRREPNASIWELDRLTTRLYNQIQATSQEQFDD
jgi:hypothetical protein